MAVGFLNQLGNQSGLFNYSTYTNSFSPNSTWQKSASRKPLAWACLSGRLRYVLLSFEEGEGVGQFAVVGLAAGSGEVALFDGFGGSLLVRRQQLFGEVMGVEADLGVVHEHQGLRGDGGAGAAADGDEGLRLVEELHHGDELAPLDHEVDAAALVGFFQRAGAEHRWRLACR